MYYCDKELMEEIRFELAKEIHNPSPYYIVEGCTVDATPFKVCAEAELNVAEFIFAKYDCMTLNIWTRIAQAVKECLDWNHDEETELDLMEWILEDVDLELAYRQQDTLDDVGMCIADFG